MGFSLLRLIRRYAALLLFLQCGDSSRVSAFTPRSMHIPSPDPSLSLVRGLSTITAVYAKPGQSEEQRKQDREEQIRAKLSQLKNSGKMKGGDESIMLEAESFFQQKSPARKFEERNRARKEEAARKKKEEEDSANTNDDDDTLKLD